MCASRNTTSPWRITGDKQDILEEYYLDFQYSTSTNLTKTPQDYRTGFTPSTWNNHSAGPLLIASPSGEGSDGFDQTQSVSSPGPLVTSLLAVFEKGSFSRSIASANDSREDYDALCQQLRQPFTGLLESRNEGSRGSLQWNEQSPRVDCQSQYVPGLLVEYLYTWLINFRRLDLVEEAVGFLMFLSNAAMLNPNLGSNVNDHTKSITAGRGMVIQKLHIRPIIMTCISILITLQLIGLMTLALYASTRPSWTRSPDSFAILRLGAALARDLPLISSVEAKELVLLDEKEGWIGERKEGRS